MSGKATGWALHEVHIPKATAKLILLALADEANNDGLSCWPSHKRIAKAANCSLRSVIRHLAAMESEGIIVVDRPASTGRGRYNRYALVMPGKTVDGQAEALIHERYSRDLPAHVWEGNHLDQTLTNWQSSSESERCQPGSEKVTASAQNTDRAVSQDPTTTQLLPELSSEKFDALSEDL